MRLAETPPFLLGTLEVRPAELTVSRPGFSEKLEPRVMETLVALARANGGVVSREALIEECWGGRAVTDDAVQRVIARLRRLSESSGGGDFSIETTPKVGYRLIAQAPAADREKPAPTLSAGSSSGTPAKNLRAGLRPASIAIGLVAILAASATAFMALRADPQQAPAPVAAAPDAADLKKIAVLPFAVSGANAPEYLAGGVALEMTDRLGRIGGLRVIAESSAAAAAAEGLGAKEIAARLDVDYLVEGDIETEDDAVALRVNLVSARDGVIEWSRSFSGPADAIGEIEANASFALIEKLMLMLGVDALPGGQPAQDPRIYSLVMQARHSILEARKLAHAGDKESEHEQLVAARAAIDAILSIDPENASGLLFKSFSAFRNRPEIGVTAAEARALLERAARSDPNHPGVLVLLAEDYRREAWRWEEAEALLARALAIDPNDAFANAYYAYLNTQLGECDIAMKYARITGELAPRQTWFQLVLPRVLKCSGDFEGSRRIYEALLAEDPQNLFLAREIYVNLMLWRDDAGLARLAMTLDDSPGGASPSARALAQRARLGADALAGEPKALLERVRADAEELRAHTADQPQLIEGRAIDDYLYFYAVEAAAAGDADFAVELLERALTARSLYVAETLPFGSSEFTPEVRAHPRYQALWRTDPALVDLVERRRKALTAKSSRDEG